MEIAYKFSGRIYIARFYVYKHFFIKKKTEATLLNFFGIALLVFFFVVHTVKNVTVMKFFKLCL